MTLLLLSLVCSATPDSVEQQRTLELNDGTVRSVVFSPDGTMVAGCADRFVQLFDVKTGNRLHRFEGHTKPVSNVAFTPDGKLLASSSADATVRLWDVKTGRSRKPLASLLRYGFACIAISPDCKTLISCETPRRTNRGNLDRHYVYLWNLSTGTWEHYHDRGDKFVYDEKPARHVTFSPNGKHLAMAEGAGSVRLYDVNFGLGKRFRWKHDDLHEVTWVAFAPDGRKLLSCGRDNTIRLWDVKSGEPLSKITGSNEGLDLEQAIRITDADRQRGEAEMQKFDSDKDGLIDPMERQAMSWRSAEFARADRDNDRNISRDEAIRRWARARRDALGATKCFQAAVFSPDGSRIISVTRDERIQIWDVESRKMLGTSTATDKSVSALALSQDGATLATCGGDKVIKLWRIKE